VAFQMAPVSVRQTEDEGTTTTEFALVPSGTQPLIAVTNGQYINGATAVGAPPEDETLSPRKKRRRGNRKKARLSGGAPTTTALSRLFKCKMDSEPLELTCEWQFQEEDLCDFQTGDIKTFMAHVSDHINNDLPIALNDLNTSSRLANEDDEDDEMKEESPKDYVCLWRGCGHQTPSSDEIVRHVHFHTFHTKLKSHGRFVLQETDNQLEPCQLDPSQCNVLPDLSEPLVCQWQGESCLDQDTTFSEPIKFYWHTQWHAEEYRGENLTSLKCLWKDCSAEAKTVSKLKDHIRVHSQERLVACPTCGGLFANRSKFFDHCKRQVAGGGSTTSLKCSYCSKRFSTERLLRDHMRAHINQFKCPLCDMTCPRPSSLAAHMSYKHFQVKTFACTKKGCGYKGKTDMDVQRHYRTHLGDESYLCPYEGCQYSARAKSNVKHHIEKVHEGSGPKYLCHLCPDNKRFDRGNYLTNHLINIHKLRWPSGHSKFRYKRDEESGLFSLQTLRFESVELVEKTVEAAADSINGQITDGATVGDGDHVNSQVGEEDLESVIMEEISQELHATY